MPEFTFIQQLCIWALPVLLAITIHEAAHAFVAYKCGDMTAKMFGRLSLNPIKHIDPIGTIVLPIAIGLMTNFSFVLGYAKPVPINWSQLRKPRRDMALVALAGPFSNFLMAFLWAACYKISIYMNPELSMTALFLFFTARAGMIINLVLAFLNLIPIPPLDGSRVVSSFLSAKHSVMYNKVEPIGLLILIILMFTGVLNRILIPLINLGLLTLSKIFQI